MSGLGNCDHNSDFEGVGGLWGMRIFWGWAMVGSALLLAPFCWLPATHHRLPANLFHRNRPRIKGLSVIPAPLQHQNSVGTCCVQCVAQL